MVNLAKLLNIKVVAEGVETLEQARYLQELDCQFGQGYLFAKPTNATQMSHLLAENMSWLVHH
ncbi:MAG: EAL domain-containing protein [Synechococcales cyanobacterium T60_A2020_003]|nr:EAL domain-containing protein [Synechococcales cyanobacterium T60_A2020_003]